MTQVLFILGYQRPGMSPHDSDCIVTRDGFVEPKDGSKKNESLPEVKHWLTSFNIQTLIVTFFMRLNDSVTKGVHNADDHDDHDDPLVSDDLALGVSEWS